MSLRSKIRPKNADISKRPLHAIPSNVMQSKMSRRLISEIVGDGCGSRGTRRIVGAARRFLHRTVIRARRCSRIAARMVGADGQRSVARTDRGDETSLSDLGSTMDQEADLHPVTCARCGATRAPELTESAARTPCPHCGATSINVDVSLSEQLTTAATASATLTPTDQARDWERRWHEVERELTELLAPQPGGMSGDAIHAARHRLHSFYVQAYHIKDALKAEAATTGIPGETVEAAITAEPALALLADLANLDKHGTLNRSPRSGHVPRIVSGSGTAATASDAGWRLDLQIEHGGRLLDGLMTAADAVDSWRRVLTGWGLL